MRDESDSRERGARLLGQAGASVAFGWIAEQTEAEVIAADRVILWPANGCLWARLHLQDLRAAERDVGVEGEVLVRRQPQPGVAAGQFGHRDLRLQLAEVRAQAVVQALAEGQVAFGVGPVLVELVAPGPRRGW